MKAKTLKLKKFKVANLTTVANIKGGIENDLENNDPISISKRPTLCPPTNTVTNPGG